MKGFEPRIGHNVYEIITSSIVLTSPYHIIDDISLKMGHPVFLVASG